jgi:hypothetical protein
VNARTLAQFGQHRVGVKRNALFEPFEITPTNAGLRPALWDLGSLYPESRWRSWIFRTVRAHLDSATE